jgi:YggT family protein
MRVAFYLLDTLFFFLVAACLLRAWMNHLRIHLSAQPGRFAMAVTNWIVVPVRRILPRQMAQANTDWGSLMAAVLLAVAYGGLWLVLAAGFTSVSASPVALMLAIPAMAIKLVLRTVLQGLMVVLLAYAILSWVQPQAPVLATLERLSAPLLRPVRRVVPLVGGVDLSVLVLIILLQVGLMLVG